MAYSIQYTHLYSIRRLSKGHPPLSHVDISNMMKVVFGVMNSSFIGDFGAERNKYFIRLRNYFLCGTIKSDHIRWGRGRELHTDAASRCLQDFARFALTFAIWCCHVEGIFCSTLKTINDDCPVHLLRAKSTDLIVNSIPHVAQNIIWNKKQ